jgi:hypothetical protein
MPRPLVDSAPLQQRKRDFKLVLQAPFPVPAPSDTYRLGEGTEYPQLRSPQLHSIVDRGGPGRAWKEEVSTGICSGVMGWGSGFKHKVWKFLESKSQHDQDFLITEVSNPSPSMMTAAAQGTWIAGGSGNRVGPGGLL